MHAKKIPIGILGATGAVGQRFLSRLAGHPDFAVAALAASEKSAGRRYGEVSPWRLSEPPPPGLSETVLRRAEPDLPCRIVFSALDAAAAAEIEPRFAAAGYLVFSNASAFRMEEDVPLLVPEVNADHVRLLPIQRSRRGWDGGILTNPNCSATQLVLALAPLQRAFGVEKVLVTTLQSVSGAGYPGVASLDALGNVLPDIPGEAAKIESESARILGRLVEGKVVPAAMTISAHTYRVPVENGHTESVSVALSRKATAREIQEAWRDFRPGPEVSTLPSSPAEAGRVPGRGPRASAPAPRRTRRRHGHVDRRPGPLRGARLEVHRRRQQHGARGGRRQPPERRAVPPQRRRGGSPGRVVTAADSRPTVVLKFGSSVLRSEDELPRAVEEIARHRSLGRAVVAVVSAIGKTTDVLLAEGPQDLDESGAVGPRAHGRDRRGRGRGLPDDGPRERGAPGRADGAGGDRPQVRGASARRDPLRPGCRAGPARHRGRPGRRGSRVLRPRSRRQDLSARAGRLRPDGPPPGPFAGRRLPPA